MAHIRKTASGRFEARFRGPDGTEHAKRFTTRRDAQTFLDRLGVDRQAGRWRDPRLESRRGSATDPAHG